MLTTYLDPTKVEAAITTKTKGIIPVHLLGHPADMDPLVNLATTHGLWVVAIINSLIRLCGSLTQPSSHFSATKYLRVVRAVQLLVTISALKTDCHNFAVRAWILTVDVFPIIGFNYRMTNVAAAILCGHLERRNEILARRQEIVALYDKQLTTIPGIYIRTNASWATVSPWLAS